MRLCEVGLGLVGFVFLVWVVSLLMFFLAFPSCLGFFANDTHAFCLGHGCFFFF